MVQAMLKFIHAVEDMIFAPTAPTEDRQTVHRVGEFYADYSPLTPEEMARQDGDCEELFRRSRTISR